MCIFKNKQGQSIRQKLVCQGNPECLCIDICWTGSSVSGSTELRDPVDDIIKSRGENYLKLMSIADDADYWPRWHWDQVLEIKIKLRPVVSFSNTDSSGVIDVTATLQALDNSFNLLKRARAQAGVARDNKTLDNKEFKAAHDWLCQTFQDRFMENQDLLDRVHDVLTGRAKKKFRHDKRDAFKAWKCSLVGNTAFLMAVLRNGLFDPQSQQQLMTAVLQEQAENTAENPPAGYDKKELRVKALQARKIVRDARKLAEQRLPVQDMSNGQMALLHELNMGVLDARRLKNDTAYGHGEGIKIRTKEEAAVLRMTCNELDAYFARSPS